MRRVPAVAGFRGGTIRRVVNPKDWLPVVSGFRSDPVRLPDRRQLQKAAQYYIAAGRNARGTTLARSLEQVGNDVVIGDPSAESIRLLPARLRELIHRFQSPQNIHMRHTFPFQIFAGLDVGPRQNCGDAIPVRGVAADGLVSPVSLLLFSSKVRISRLLCCLAHW